MLALSATFDRVSWGTMALCEIVIPYFQRKPGILGRVLTAVSRQTFQDFRVIIVDDASPSPPELEVAPLDADMRAKIAIVKRENGGASAARNTGLDNLSDDARFVALLDSDDIWTPDHLERAVATLSGGPARDLYWDQIKPSEQEDQRDFAPTRAIAPAALSATDEAGLSRVDNMFDLMCGPWWRHLHLSIFVMSRPLADAVRFNTTLKYSEDFDFFIDCAEHAREVYCSDAYGVEIGDGLNIWKSLKTDDYNYCLEKFCFMTACKRILGFERVSAKQAQDVRTAIQICREQFYWSQSKRTKQRRGPDVMLWLRWMLRDPALFRSSLEILLKRSPTGGNTPPPAY
ncbi:MAG: glycosyltransferase family A protein [Pseudomonadota bacterium]